MRPRPWLLIFLPLLVACGSDNEPFGDAAQSMAICAAGATLRGIDVSHYNGDIDWAAVAASGTAFAFAKATEGLTFVDPAFSQNWAGMRDNGVVRGAYHFFHADEDPIAEADHFLETVGPLSPGDLPPTLDLEVTDDQDAATITKQAKAWLDRVGNATGTTPLLYTTPNFATETLGSPPELEANARLWVANWDVKCPKVPSPFASWAFWQDSNTGVVPGIDAATDLDVFNGTLTDLAALTLASASLSDSSAATAGGAGGTAATNGSGGAATVTSTTGAGGGTSAGGAPHAGSGALPVEATGGGGAAEAGAIPGAGGNDDVTSTGASSKAEVSSGDSGSASAPPMSAGCALAPAHPELRGSAWLLSLAWLAFVRRRRTRRIS